MEPSVTQPVMDHYEKLYTMLLENIPSSVLLIDRGARVAAVNQNFLTKSRRTRPNTVGKKLTEVFPAVILDQLNILDKLHQVISTAQPTPGQRMYYRAPGVVLRYYYYRLLPVVWQGEVENVILLMVDITDQVEMGREMQRLHGHLTRVVESASEIVVSMDPAGKVLSWNPAAEKISGYAFHEAQGKAFTDFISPASVAQVRKLLARIDNRSGPDMLECEVAARQGSMIAVAWIFSSLQTAAGQDDGIVAVGRDLSHQRILEQRLLESEKLASLGVMAGGIAHEIRNPLATCSSAAQFLQDEDITPEFRRECAAKIHKNLNKVSDIIENLLSFSRMTPGYDKELVAIDSLLEDVLLLVANQAKFKRVRIESAFAERSCRVCGNASLLQQLFTNLLLNGIKAMPDGGLLRIALTLVDSEAVVTIADTGCGIAGEHLDKIFDPFFTTAPIGEGTGLGLAICYAIVEQHKGRISVQSTLGHGAEFTVRLPFSSKSSPCLSRAATP